MSTTTRFPLMKKQIINSQATGGRCYVRLLPLIPSFKNCDLHQLEDAIIDVTSILGRNPKGTSVLAALWHAEGVVSDREDSAVGLEHQALSAPASFIEGIMESPVRFGFEELSGVMHITYYLEEVNNENDLDSPIETELGWASRFIIQQMCNVGRHIGADDDLDDLFGSLLNSKAPPYQQAFDEPKIQLYSDDADEREAQSRVEDAFNRLEALNSKRQQTRGVSSKNDQAELLERLTRMEEKVRSILSIREEATISPDDSSSNIGRYQKKFMKVGPTIESIDESENEQEEEQKFKSDQIVNSQLYNVNKQGTVLAIEQEIPRLNVMRDVVVGYKKTHDMCRTEQKIMKTIHPINGLANPFRSNRLNLLIHFHTAISNVLPNCTRQSYIEMMWYMMKYKSKTPSEELTYQVVSKTFDMDQLKVISNPFKLPFIEVGMQINDPTLVKCFTMLKNEYKQLWFTEMKHLWVPDFHNEFSDFIEGKMTGSSQNIHQTSTEEGSGRHKSASSSGKSRGYYERPSRKPSKGGNILTMRSEK